MPTDFYKGGEIFSRKDFTLPGYGPDSDDSEMVPTMNYNVTQRQVCC